MAGIEANEWCYAVCFAVFIKRISIMGSVQQELFNMKPRKVGFMEKNVCRNDSISCWEARSSMGKTGRSFWESAATNM